MQHNNLIRLRDDTFAVPVQFSTDKNSPVPIQKQQNAIPIYIVESSIAFETDTAFKSLPVQAEALPVILTGSGPITNERISSLYISGHAGLIPSTGYESELDRRLQERNQTPIYIAGCAPSVLAGFELSPGQIIQRDPVRLHVGDSAFLPSNIPGLFLWLRSETDLYQDNPPTIEAEDGDDVSYWGDQSGFGNHATQDAIAPAKPVLDDSVALGLGVQFNAGSWLETSFSITQPYTMLAVVRAVNTLTARYIYSDDSNDSFAIVNSSEKFVAGTSASLTSTSDIVTGGNYVTAIYNGANSVLRVDGTTEATGDMGLGNITNLIVGNSDTLANEFEQHIYEFLVYDKVLAAQEISLVEGYLATRFGL